METRRLLTNFSGINKIYVILSLLIIITVRPVAGQLTDKDIAVLKERAVEEGWTFEVGENAATRRPLEQLCGDISTDNQIYEKPLSPILESTELPEAFDWRDLDGCTPIKDQDGCGSCWAHAAIGVVESKIKIVDSVEVDLSEQWAMSCTDAGGCGGGSTPSVFNYMYKWLDNCNEIGAVLEADFPYAAMELPCNCPYERPYRIDSWTALVNYPPKSQIKSAILTYGPVKVSVYVNDAFKAYNGGVFNACEDNMTNHAVVLVGWDDNLGENGAWILRNSWGTEWGEDGYMYIEYGCSRVDKGALYVDYFGIPKIGFEYPTGIPDHVRPDQPDTFEVVVLELADTPVSGSGQLHYIINDGPVTTVSMIETESNHYLAVLPAIECGDRIKFYVSAEADRYGKFYDPEPESAHDAFMASEFITVFEDDFETDRGWTVTGDAADGYWERGVPIEKTGDWYGFPPTWDYDGSGCCYLTDNVDSSSYVKDGTTSLISPLIDINASDAVINFARWYSNDYRTTPAVEVMNCYISNDDGISWILFDTYGPEEKASGFWYEEEYIVSDFVEPSSSIRLRFDASELSLNPQPVEAAIDMLSVKNYFCYEFICGDVNNNMIGPDISDITFLIAYLYLNGEEPYDMRKADVNGSGGTPDISDITALIQFLYLDGPPLQCLEY